MVGVVPVGAESDFLDAILRITAAEELDLCLFRNNRQPAKSDVVADYTEATFTGYSRVPLTSASWVKSGSNPTIATYPIITFTSTADQTPQIVYGYYVIGRASGRLKWSERFTDTFGIDSPQVVQFLADIIQVTPKFGDS